MWAYAFIRARPSATITNMSIYRWFQIIVLAVSGLGATAPVYAENPRVAVTTEFGTFEIELLEKLSPRTVSNFLQLVEDEFYDGLVFHRVIANFMVQGGGYTADLKYKPGPNKVPNESFNGVKNTRGTVAMARLSDPDSADTQFFINVGDNPHLDADGNQAGYAVFGRISSGMEVVQRIELVNTSLRQGMAAVPDTAVVIVTIRRI